LHSGATQKPANMPLLEPERKKKEGGREEKGEEEGKEG
jgi:hypothetical protein